MKAAIRSFRDATARQEALTLLGRGEPIILPTDTVYGLAARLDTGGERLMRLLHPQKRRPWAMIPLLLADADLLPVLARPNPTARRLTRHFWPGALTLLLPPSAVLSPWGRAVAVRLPGLPSLRDFLRAAGGWLVVWRAARPGEPDAVTADDALRAWGKEVPLILDDGPSPLGIRSTVVDATQNPPRVVQRGALPPEALRIVLPEVRS